ncbi:serine/threonine-protein kinase [Streptomyces lavendulae]|uniref:serine/threonine-protein kinase n=1 Tax=Streptomyces lavendulae TaxID=1914 RepID=UPI00332CBB3D
MLGEQDGLVDGRYRFVSAIGKGGMGQVWLAHDEKLKRDVALKQAVFRLDGETSPEAQKARFIREAEALAKLQHAGIVGVIDVLKDLDPPIMVMEYVKGQSLKQVLRDQGPLSIRETARIGLAILDALTEMHSQNVVHRDLKPDNIVVAGPRVVVVDFGIALVKDATQLTMTGGVPGSVHYVAPERLRGDRGQATSDLWSLGVTLYELVEGRLPFPGDFASAIVLAICGDDPQPTQRAGELAPILLGLLTREPEARLTAESMRAALAEIAAPRNEPQRSQPCAPGPAPTAITLAALPTVTAVPDTRVAVPAEPRERPVKAAPAQGSSAIEGEGSVLDVHALAGLPSARMASCLADLWEAGEKNVVHAALKRVGGERLPAELVEVAHALRSGRYSFLAANLARYAGRLQQPTNLAQLITLLRAANGDRDADEALVAAGKGRPLNEVNDVEASLRARNRKGQGLAAKWRIEHDLELVRKAAAGRPKSGALSARPAHDQPFVPFWFAVPEQRQLVSEGQAPHQVVTQLFPGTWYLAVGWHEGWLQGRQATALIAQTADSKRGLLWNTHGIQRG